ncbi:hypothetical protein DBR43_31810 [Pedobacter sp. KBW06]|uniref:HNH endonuclease n=1 Tax=Pedobacter sp. KBW06 TaxID=2153359 RepID=UPI000F5A0F99|nr:HNH endonuclease [Pedobacter sp. KBW06]RQO64867.1 hypothetical protein DBR43_31810 [Pedobacter sp. KBW06]
MRWVDKNSLSEHLKEASSILEKINDYNDDVRIRDIIRDIYSGCCAYCGSSPESASYFQIEHFYPKNSMYGFDKYEKDIKNLHYSCQRCNALKREIPHPNLFSPNFYLIKGEWVHSNPDKFKRELIYVGHLLYSRDIKNVDRGQYSIDLFDLNNLNGSGRSNRSYLVEARIKVYDEVFQLLNLLYTLLEKTFRSKEITQIEKEILDILFIRLIKYMSPDAAYSNMVIDNFGESLLELLGVFSKIK